MTPLAMPFSPLFPRFLFFFIAAILVTRILRANQRRSRRGLGDPPRPARHDPAARRPISPPPIPGKEEAPFDFKCDNCGATHPGPFDLSPSGDLKCPYCDKWFNVRK